ncbi:MAG: hypothetical protein M3264_12270 [Thermoproteota archaeon]|nr:hypothetical protein [Thermoproteota archaeon]
MMVLLVASSLIGTSSIHQFVEGQTPPPAATPKPQQPSQKATYVMGRATLKTYKRILRQFYITYLCQSQNRNSRFWLLDIHVWYLRDWL